MHHLKDDQDKDAMAVWAEKSDAVNEFRACVVEMRLSTGMHSGLVVVSMPFHKCFLSVRDRSLVFS